MHKISQTLYIPLYGKAFVSKQGIILDDPKAEEIWSSVALPLKRKSRSKWLAYFMAMRARVFDDWVHEELALHPDSIVLHIGCGLDSRNLRVEHDGVVWIDADLPEVVSIRRKIYDEFDDYRMVEFDATGPSELKGFPSAPHVIVAMEGISMYLSKDALIALFVALREKYLGVHILIDTYTEFGARATKLKNPINEVGVTEVFGTDSMQEIARDAGYQEIRELSLTPDRLIDDLSDLDRVIFKMLYGGSVAQKTYRLYELDFQHRGDCK